MARSLKLDLPASVVRDRVVFPLSKDNDVWTIAVSDPLDFDTLQTLQGILDKEIRPVLAARNQILEASARHYGELAK